MYRKQFKESATRTSMFDDITSQRQSEMSPSPEKDRTHLSFEESMLEIAREVGPNTFISFVDPWSTKTPSAGINPKAKFRTPHGFYAYPLDEKNFTRFIQTGKPTNAIFATNKTFFHVIKASDQGSVRIGRDNTTDKYTKINSVEEAKNDIKEIFRLCYIANFDKIDVYPDYDYNPEEYIYKYKTTIPSEYEVFKLFRYYKTFDTYFKKKLKSLNPFKDKTKIKKEHLEVKKDFYNFMVNFMYRLSLEYSYKSEAIKSKSQGYLFHVVYYSAIKLIENVRYYAASDEKLSVTLSNFLHSIGIKSIVDKGSSTMHENEPSQAVIINQGPNSNYELVGTYANYTSELGSSNYSRYVSEFSDERLEVLAKVIHDTSNNITETSVEDPDLTSIDGDHFDPEVFKKKFKIAGLGMSGNQAEKMNAEVEKHLASQKLGEGITKTYIRHVIDSLSPNKF